MTERRARARPAGKSGKREAADKPAAKEPKKAKKDKAAPAKKPAAQEEPAAAADVEMKEEEPAVVGSGRQAAQVRRAGRRSLEAAAPGAPRPPCSPGPGRQPGALPRNEIHH